MNQETNTDQNLLKMLSSDDAVLRTEALYNLTFEEVDNEVVKTITELILADDKAIRNAASNFLIQNNNPTIPFAVVDYIGSPEISIRNLAGEILLKKGTNSVDAICAKVPTLKEDDDIKFLVDILGLIGDKCPEDLIIDILTTNQNENVIVACIEALGNIYSEKAIETIIPFFDKAEVLRPVVIEATGKIRTLKSLKFITEKFKSDDDLLKFTMIESMGEIGDEETFYFLLSQIDILNGALIWPLLEAIYKLKIKHDLEVPFDERIKKCVLDTIINAEPRYQIVAAHLVTVFDDPEILYACLSIYGLDSELNEVLFDKFMENKGLIVSKLYTVIDNNNNYLSAILDLLQNILSYDSECLTSLGELERRRLTESLSQSLTNSDEGVRIAAAELLFRIDTETALLFLDTMISDENFWNRIRLLDMISEMDRPEVIEALEKLSQDSEEMVSDKAKEIALRKQYLTN
ncbi:MAG: HEAT repeat domain-containing protein [Ignavibacteriales bacterium]|nr:HEAT repeat domain-containing protein [Ignavibacteriales bacterium]